MTLRKYLILVAVVIFGSCGDVCLGRGMRDFGPVTSANWTHLLSALWNPWVLGGIALLLLFFCSYLTALSWADLTYVLPATGLSYVIMALLAKFFLHEHVSSARWLGIVLITIGVGFVATGPAVTTHHDSAEAKSLPAEVPVGSGTRSNA